MIYLFVPDFIILLKITSFMTFLAPMNSPKKQGLEGYIYRISGNQMPSPDRKTSPPKGIKTILYVFELTNITQATRKDNSSFFSIPENRLVKKTESNDDGYFKVDLPAGKYSVFTKKDEWFYANWFDADNNISPAAVSPGKMTRIEVRVDYDASY